MRQVGILPNEQQASRFADYLVTQNIQAHAEPDGDGWAVWVRDEEHVQQAIGELKDFRGNPDDRRYQHVATQAEAIRQEEVERRRAASKNVIEMRGNWSRGMTRRAPLTFILIAGCVLVFFLTGFTFHFNDPTAKLLFFENPVANYSGGLNLGVFSSIQQGQLWRLITPVFLHAGAIHIFFNAYLLYYFGGQMESRRGWLRYIIFVLLAAAFSNVAQAYISGNTYFGGFSGVNYALFGYIWMQSRYVPKSGFVISQINIILLVGWFFAGFLPFGMFEHIANVAHGGGLFFGMVVGYLPVLFPTLEGKI